MTMDEIKNQIQLETINVNKKIANKRRWIKSKEKIDWRVDMNFCMTNMQSKEEREGKERKKSIFELNHVEPSYICHQKRKRMPRRIKCWGRITVTTARASRTRRQKAVKWLMRWGLRGTCLQLFCFFCVQKLKMSLGLDNIDKQTMVKLQPSPWSQG